MFDADLRYLTYLTATLHETGDERSFLERVCQLTLHSAAADGASVVTRHRGRLITVASTGLHAAEADALQAALDEGPTLDVLVDGAPQRSPDLQHDKRWPGFGAAAGHSLGVISALSLVLHREPDHGYALNLYSTSVDAFSLSRTQPLEALVSHARMALLAHRERSAPTALREALESNRRVGAAIGVVMHSHKVTSAQALTLLKRAARAGDRSLGDLAEDVLDTGVISQRPARRWGRAHAQ